MEEGQEDEDTTAKVGQLSRITTDLRKQLKELKAQQQPSTRPEVLKEHRKTIFEDVERIKQGEKLYTEVVDVVSATWELLLEDEAVEKTKEDAWQDDLKIIAVKADMKKLSIKEKIAKVVELKQLQQQVKTLHDQE